MVLFFVRYNAIIVSVPFGDSIYLNRMEKPY
nr:MAG TPA: hypothetical protein [Caudoviricetes sp.]